MDFSLFHKNKQWLALSFCLASICLLPTNAQAADAPTSRDQNAAITPYPTTFSATYSKARAPLAAQEPQEEVNVQESADNQAPVINDRAFRGLDQSEINTRQTTVSPQSPDVFMKHYANSPSLDNNTDDQDIVYQEASSPNMHFAGSEWSPSMNDENSLMLGNDTWNAPTWQDDSSWGTQSSCCAPPSCCPVSSCCAPPSCLGNFRLFADFLYWNVCQNNLDYAMTVTDVNGLDATMSIGPDTFPIWLQGNYKVKSVSSKYKPGFRVGGFYSAGGCCGGWDFGIVYTQLDSHYTNHVFSHGAGELVLPTQIPNLADAAELLFRNVLGGDSPAARSKLSLNYNMVDLLATTSYSSGGCFAWQPYAGVRFLEIKEKWNIEYTFNPSVSSLPVTSILLTSRWHSKIPAAGLTAGISGSISFCDCFSVIGRVGASCVGGRAKARTHLTGDFTADSSVSGSAAPTRVSKNKCSILTGFEGALGLAYTFKCCQTGVQIAAGYEFQNWYNVPTPIEHGILIPGIESNPSSNLSLHGLFVRAGIAF